MDRFECFGHRLDLQRQENEITARCQCGAWRRVMLLSGENELGLLVARLVGEHHRHVDGWGHPAAEGATG